MPAGYSGTPLAKKLGVKDGHRTWRHDMPVTIAEEIESTGVRPAIAKVPKSGLEMAHIFVTRRDELAHLLAKLRSLLDPAGTVWVSWPKKAAQRHNRHH
jgi:hypothetical protein